MNKTARGASLFVLALLSAGIFNARAQSAPTATQALRLSAFGGVTGTYTGFLGGRNLGLTAGGDLGFRSFYTLHPFLEVRGTYPVAKGQVDSQRNVLGGLKVSETYGRFHPYANILFGRGQINYAPGRVNPDRTFYYIQTVSNVLSPGAGLDFDLSDHLSAKIDAQLQRYASPVTPSGRIYAKVGTLGIVYRFDFNDHRRRRR